VAQNVKTDARKKTLIKYFPTGTVLQVLPFAFPFWINFKMALPQLLLGNSVLVRNSDSTPGVGRMV
jgi:acyl-CoA reductase-like NAD-dependent aldehyde dehydrogenase